ncbi:MAG: acyl-CoA dehydratase activase-related protein [Clostridia bacterium]
MKLGIDIGSTTIKFVLLSENDEILYSTYERHLSKIKEKMSECLERIYKKFPETKNLKIAITGSAGMGLSERFKIDFVQEVYATKIAINEKLANTDIVIELGGEDAKILFLSNGLEVRMNGSCAGGTGAFIDQISTLLHLSPTEMNELSKNHEKIYPIASRCGVFAKSDIQPLLNQGARKEDISASIFYAMVNQTITGLAQGREISGKVVYLGGPLTFLSELRTAFDDVLNLKGISPENSLYYVAIGAALSAENNIDVNELLTKLKTYEDNKDFNKEKPLFKSKEEYDEFVKRHAKAIVKENLDKNYSSDVYIGVDAGSTTVKMVAIDKKEEILFTKYMSNGGNPVPMIKSFLEEFYQAFPNVNIVSATATGYGEEIIKNAFSFDFGIVETVAHYEAAKKFNKDVNFIIDIGGQDIKCFKVQNGAIDDIYLNEACSSGCGSFLQSFASVLGYDMAEFAKLGLFAETPVDLGSRCTVFMNSSVKQAQKDGASVENISAGLSISVVKNALYKVIRATSAEELGKNIVVQGGTFLSDAVLRAFEKEIKGNVIRPNISGIMGAYGAALYGKKKATNNSKILNLDNLSHFKHNTQMVNCNKCTNHCSLTINTFDGGRKYIAGNRCDAPIIGNSKASEKLNLFTYKKELLSEYINKKIVAKRGTIGIPLVLNMFELLPFWSKFFHTLGFNVVTTDFSDNDTYIKGQRTIPSDTICFPAKLVHGHIEDLLKKDIDAVFYPCLTYNIDEKRGDNHYNCPVVAYYPEVVAGNIPAMNNIKFIYDYLGIHRVKDFSVKIRDILRKNFMDIPLKEVKIATDLAFKERDVFLEKVRAKASEIISTAREENKPIIVLAGRPYHLDPQVNHGIDKLVASYGVATLTEDAVSHLYKSDKKVSVLNQWTYHSRLYDCAKYVGTQKDMNLIQLVSFGCGMDAITSDEVRKILYDNDKIYTQIKIDEITNLGAVKIRLRSLLATIE